MCRGISRLTAELSFRDGVELLKETTGITISSKENQLISEGIGEEIEENLKREVKNEYREKGYFIGSGVVEGGCKHIVGARLKQSGMKWSERGVKTILQLRICCLNKRWDRYWKEKLKAA